MIEINVLLTLVFLHFFADFILQTDNIALKKSTNNEVLFIHVFLYSLPFLWFGLKFALVTFIAHFLTDYVSSRLTSKFYKEGKRHLFFVTIGADQAIHMATLFLTYLYIK